MTTDPLMVLVDIIGGVRRYIYGFGSMFKNAVPNGEEEEELDDGPRLPRTKYGSELDLTGAAIALDNEPQHPPGEYHPTQTPSIELPNQVAEYVSHIALDIGGSLIKLIYFSPDPSEGSSSGSSLSMQDTATCSPAFSAASSARPVNSRVTGGSMSLSHANNDSGASTGCGLHEGAGLGEGQDGQGLPARGAGEEHDAAASSTHARASTDGTFGSNGGGLIGGNGRGGRLHFVKFESARVEDAITFIEERGLHRNRGKNGQKEVRVIATGGGAFKHAEIFKQRLGVVLEKEDEIACLVGGTNFLLQTIPHEAFTYTAASGTTFAPTNEESDLYPYLLVNIGSGVSMVQVTGVGEYERISGSSLGGGTFWGLCQLLTGLKNFDEMLELSMGGDNRTVDMLVGDIYGGRDYSTIGLSADTIASSFGKVVSQDKELAQYPPADIAMALCRMLAYNIGQLAYLNAMRYKLKRIFFGGFFIRGHPYTMDTLSYAIRFWSRGEMAAMFLRHEGFLGAMGAFLKVHPMGPTAERASTSGQPRKVRARFTERFTMSAAAPFAGSEAELIASAGGSDEKASWVDKFLASGMTAVAAASHPPSPHRSADLSYQIPPSAQEGTPSSEGPKSTPEESSISTPLSVPEKLSTSTAASGSNTTCVNKSPSLASGGSSASDLRSSPSCASAALPGAALEQLSLGGGVSRMSHLNRVSSCAAAATSAANSSPGRSDPGSSAATTPSTTTSISTPQPACLSTLSSVSSEFNMLTYSLSPVTSADLNSQQRPPQSQSNSQVPDQLSSQQALPQASTTPIRRAVTSTPAQTQSATTQQSLGRTSSLCTDQGGSSQNLRDHMRTSLQLQVGVLHYTPSLEPFPLLADPSSYDPNTFDINASEEELHWWLLTLEGNIPTTVDKAVASEGGGEAPRRRAAAFGRAFAAHLQQLRSEPRAYGRLGLAQLLEMREDCLRESGFADSYRLEKERENQAALAVLPDLLLELDQLDLQQRLLVVVEGVLAANIFDWGSSACVSLYRDGTILQIYRAARQRLSRRPWAIDEFDQFSSHVLQSYDSSTGTPLHPPYRRVMMFVDNSGADIVLGMLPFAREMLRLGCEVVLVANSLPAINDITASELRVLLAEATQHCPVLRAARSLALQVKQRHGGHIPPFPGAVALHSPPPPGSHSAGINSGAPSPTLSQKNITQTDAMKPPAEAYSNLAAAAGNPKRVCPTTTDPMQASAAAAASAAHTDPQKASAAGRAAAETYDNLSAKQTEQQTDPMQATLESFAATSAAVQVAPLQASADLYQPLVTAAAATAAASSGERAAPKPSQPATEAAHAVVEAANSSVNLQANQLTQAVPSRSSIEAEPGRASAAYVMGPKLWVVANGHGSPCLDLRRVPDLLAEACMGVDLVVIEGMGRAIHTNFKASFKCDVLKVAMIKTERIAKQLFEGSLYDCVCTYTSPSTVE